jgi:hypothetical protein
MHCVGSPHDGIEAEKRSRATVTIITDAFTQAARIRFGALGLPEHPVEGGQRVHLSARLHAAGTAAGSRPLGCPLLAGRLGPPIGGFPGPVVTAPETLILVVAGSDGQHSSWFPAWSATRRALEVIEEPGAGGPGDSARRP